MSVGGIESEFDTFRQVQCLADTSSRHSHDDLPNPKTVIWVEDAAVNSDKIQYDRLKYSTSVKHDHPLVLLSTAFKSI